jgi:hypothetical protein
MSALGVAGFEVTGLPAGLLIALTGTAVFLAKAALGAWPYLTVRVPTIR